MNEIPNKKVIPFQTKKFNKNSYFRCLNLGYMKYAIASSAVIPLRPEPSEKSEMLTQVMFGECVEFFETTGNWAKVITAFDAYEGWIDKKMMIEISETEFLNLSKNVFVLPDLFAVAIDDNNTHYLLPAGSSLPGFNTADLSFLIGSKKFRLKQKPLDVDKSQRMTICNIATSFLNSTYLWGGKNPFGIDCSGLSQVCYKIAGLPIPRDASKQVNNGTPVSFLENSKPGDLAFFDNDESNIVHVGILLNPNKIIHASGKVRIDTIDHQGIFNNDLQKYSHKLRTIISIID